MKAGQWAVGIMAVPLVAAVGEPKVDRPPNILFLMAEDIGPDLACYGTRGVRTPVLDRLAREGIRYDRFYTTSPICSPSRTAIMTGMYQTSIGAHHHRSNQTVIPDHVLPLTHYLREAGYETILGSDRVLEEGLKIDVNVAGWRRNLFDRVEGVRGSGPRREPFFQQVQHKVTHRDHRSPRWLEHREQSPHPVCVDEVEVPPYLPDTPQVRFDIANYLDTIEVMDHEVGLLLEDLEKEGVLDNTVIIFIGDNGRNQIRGKSYLWEDGILCPMIIWGPGIGPGEVNTDLISGIDLTATILHLAGVEVPDHMQGQAFLFNENYRPREYVFAARDRHDEVMDCSRAIVGERFKYIRNYMPEVPWDARMRYYESPLVRPLLPHLRELNARGKLTPEQAFFFSETKPNEQLYDLEKDPWELRNLSDNPEYLEVREMLRGKLNRWIEESGDQGLRKNENGEFVPAPEQT